MRMNGEDDRNPTLARLETLLDEAMKRHAVCEQAERDAQRELTAARNEVNACQKALDKRLDEIRAKAPWNTDWHSKRNPGHPVESSING